MVKINSFKSGIWQITFDAQITSVLFSKFFKILIFSILKNLFIVLMALFVAFKATFSDGSKPTQSILEFLKLLRKVPSFDPISINFELDFKKLFFIQSAYFLKWRIINFELPV